MNLTVTIPTGKAGQQAYFYLTVEKKDFLHVVDLDFSSIAKLQELEKTEPFTINK